MAINEYNAFKKFEQDWTHKYRNGDGSWDKFKSSSKNVLDNAWQPQNALSSVSSILGGVAGIGGSAKSNSTIQDTSVYHNDIDIYGSSMFSDSSFNSLVSDYSNNRIPTMPSIDDIRKPVGEKLTNTLSGTLSGAMAGLSVGGGVGALIGGALGLGAGVGGWILGDLNADREKNALEVELKNAQRQNLDKFRYSASVINDDMFNAASLNYRAYGGDLYDKAMITRHYNQDKIKSRKLSYIGNLFAYGGQMKLAGDWSNGVTIIGEGGSHETNPYSGVQVGIDQNGIPNLVEEGEVIFNDYVYSNRLKPSDKQLEEVGLCPSFSGETFADIAKKISTESEERPNDPISKNGLIDGMIKLQTIQEEVREKKALTQLRRQLNKMSPQEKTAFINDIAQQSQMSQTGEQMPEEEIQSFDFNGRYSENGNPQEDLNTEYQNAYGGNLYPWGGNIDENGNPIINKDNPWNLSKEFIYYKNGQYDKGYLDWLNNYDFENSPHWDYLQKFYNSITGKNLTASKARSLGQDRQFGEFHRALGDLYTNSWAAPLPELDDNINTDFDFDIDEDIFAPLDTKTNEYTPIKKYSFAQKFRSGTNDLLRYAPVIGSGIQVLGDLFGLTNRYDYRNADRIGKTAARIRNIRAPRLYDYIQYNPYDVNYQQNRLQNVGLGSQRNILNTTSGNRAAALASLLAAYNSTMSGMGDMYRSAKEYNDNQRKMVSEFNRGTNQFNAQSFLTAEQANQNADKIRADILMKDAIMRDQIDTTISAAKSNNISNLFTNMGKVGQDIYYGGQADWYLKNVLPRNEQTKTYNTGKNGGKIRKHKRLI